MEGQVKVEENTLRFFCQFKEISSYNGEATSKIYSQIVNYCSKEGKKSQWRLKLFPYGCTECFNCVSLFVELIQSDDVVIRTDAIRFSVLSGLTKKLVRELDAREFSVNTGSWGFFFFIGHNILFNVEDNWVPNNTLSIACKIQFPSTDSEQEALVPLDSSIDLIYADKDSFVNDKLADVALMVDSKIINAQKEILASSSSTFALKLDNLGSQYNILEIQGYTYEVVFELVRFMYTGKVENLKNLGMEMFSASNEYNLPTLVDICAKDLAKNMTLDSCIEILIQADNHKCLVLKKYSIDYIRSHFDELSESDVWQESHNSLTDVLIKCLNNP